VLFPPESDAQLANFRGVLGVMRVYAGHMRSRTDDAALVRRTQAGDEGAFEAIFKRHHAPLLSYCRHMLGNQPEGEDALQQAFIKAHQALLSGTAPRELRPWLYAIARNCCLTAIATRRGWVGIESLEDHTPALAGLSDEVRQREDLRELLAGISRLPEDQRSALLLAELDDLDHQAIATIVGCRVSKVKALIYQARSSLIADRDARETPCQEIREQLSVAHGGELRRGPLRRHLKLCVGCRDFQLAVSAQRQSFGVLLPVLPSTGLAAAILGHGAAHVAGAASVGGAGAGAAGLGGTGIAASGLVTKLAVGGAVVVLASAGAVTVHNRAAHATPDRATSLRLAASSVAGRRIPATEVAGSSDGLSDSLASGSPALALANGTAPATTPGLAGSGSLTEPTSLGGVNPLLAPSDALAPSGAEPGSPGQPAVTSGKRKSGAGDPAARAKHRAELARRKALLRRKAALLRRRASARRRARLRREALLRQQRAERRARREALERRRRLAKPPTPKPAVTPTPTPTRIHHRKAPPAPTPTPTTTPTPVPTGNSTTGSTTPEAGKPRQPKQTTTGTETSPTPKAHPKKHPVEEEGKEKEEQQLPNLEAEPEVKGVDVQPTPTGTETGGTHHAS
jgi:RNA polymerase sigma factor (sigma-70 family)